MLEYYLRDESALKYAFTVSIIGLMPFSVMFSLYSLITFSASWVYGIIKVLLQHTLSS